MRKSLWVQVFLIMSLNLGLLSCESNPPQSSADLPMKVSKSATATTASTSTKVILRLHGSNTIGANLVPTLAKAFLEQEGATTVKLVPVAHEEVNIEGQFNDGTVRVIEIQAHGSSTGFKDLANNQCDIGMASRKIKDKEVQTLSALGDMTAPDSEHVLAVDGIAVIVHPSNPVVALEKEKLARIFSGQFQTWEQAGSNNTDPINVYARDDKSGTYDTFKSLVLEPYELKLTDTVKRFDSNADLEKAVAADRQGIGFTSLPYVKNTIAIGVSDGAYSIIPDKLSIGTEDYPLSRRVYLYASPQSQNPYTQKFIDFALSAPGQKIASKVGFIDLNIEMLQPPRKDIGMLNVQNEALVKEYFNTIRAARKLSTSFRFLENTMTLDNKGQRDIDRIIEFLQQRSQNQVLVLGFSDSNGDYEASQLKSKQRAESVAKTFKARGIQPALVTGYGEELRIASDDSDQGRIRNRRVEIWLK